LQNEMTMEEIYPLLLEVVESGGEFRLYPRGTSMLPMLREGIDSVLLAKPLTLSPLDICLYRRENGQFVLHRLMHFDEAGDPVFCGDNQLAPEYGIKREQIIAKVTSYYRGDEHVLTDSPKYLSYLRRHCNLRYRKLYFLPRRIKGRIKRILSKQR